jgi:hypothetical protein
VCTAQTTDGQPGLEGYYLEHDRDLAPEERLRFAPGEEGPPFDPARAPRVEGAGWPAERLRKIVRNYAMDYVRSLLPELVAAVGPAEARYLGGTAATLIGMQHYADTARALGVEGHGPGDFAELLRRLGAAQGDDVACAQEGAEWVVRQRTWRLMEGVRDGHPALFEAWNGLWEGALAVHDRRLTMTVTRRLDLGDEAFEWRIRPRGSAERRTTFQEETRRP